MNGFQTVSRTNGHRALLFKVLLCHKDFAARIISVQIFFFQKINKFHFKGTAIEFEICFDMLSLCNKLLLINCFIKRPNGQV